MDHSLEALKEQHLLNEIDFWGVHDFQDGTWSMGCRLCGNMFWEPMHTGKLDAFYSD